MELEVLPKLETLNMSANIETALCVTFATYQMVKLKGNEIH